MGWVVVGTAVFGAPRFCTIFAENAVFSGVFHQNRGAPKTAVPTTTIPHFPPSYALSVGTPVTGRPECKGMGSNRRAIAWFTPHRCGPVKALLQQALGLCHTALEAHHSNRSGGSGLEKADQLETLKPQTRHSDRAFSPQPPPSK